MSLLLENEFLRGFFFVFPVKEKQCDMCSDKMSAGDLLSSF